MCRKEGLGLQGWVLARLLGLEFAAAVQLHSTRGSGGRVRLLLFPFHVIVPKVFSQSSPAKFSTQAFFKPGANAALRHFGGQGPVLNDRSLPGIYACPVMLSRYTACERTWKC